MKGKLKIAVLFGGCSPEYEVSLQSAYSVIKHMDKTRFVPVLIGITRQGDWYCYNGDIERIPADTWHGSDCVPVIVSPSRSEHALLCLSERNNIKIPVDAAFPVLHGKNGEDGTVQGVFELAGIPVIGCGTLSSALCMDKDRAHKLVHMEGIAVPASYVLNRNTVEKNTEDENADNGNIMALAEQIGYPLFVKPVKAGSSYGVTKVLESQELLTAIELAFRYDDKVIMEECIPGFEVGCAVMGNEDLTVGEVDEIELADGFFDYKEKYTLKTSAIHVPARIDADTAAHIKETAVRIYRALDCHGFARVDMFLTPSGRIVFNEVNTIPGFTSHSRFPNMMEAAGISLKEVITRVIEGAVGK